MSLPKFSVNNSLFVNLISVILLIIGMMVVFGLNREVFPNVSFGYIVAINIIPHDNIIIHINDIIAASFIRSIAFSFDNDLSPSL